MKPSWIRRDIVAPANEFERDAVRHVQLVLRCADINGEMDGETVTRIRGIQMLFGLPVTGALDIPTAVQIERLVNQYAVQVGEATEVSPCLET